ncbi:MAG: hypothetical protein AB7U05_03195 [Mangrovibacterium sp.]
MKKYSFLLVFLLMSTISFAQQSYQYVIIPTGFSDIGSGFNPHGVSSALQQLFDSKSIKTVFETAERPADYCEALTVDLEKVPNMFQNRLLVKLKDCQNRTVWSQEGKGRSKDFQQGYAEALADALSELKALPENVTVQPGIVAPVSQPEARVQMQSQSQVQSLVSTPVGNSSADDEIYRPQNLYYNFTYFVDVVAVEQGKKRLVLVNSELLGYENLQSLAMLTPSGLNDVYTVEWTRADGTIATGVANLTAAELKISLPAGQEMEVIRLIKY